MKKLLIFMIIILGSLAFYNPHIGAASVLQEEPAANTGGLWHVEDGNRVYVYMRYMDGGSVIETGDTTNPSYPTYDYSLFTYWPTGSEDDYTFSNTGLKYATISNPDPTVYDKFNVEIIPSMTVTSGPEPSFKVIGSFTSSVINEVRIDLYDWADRPNTNYLYDYSYLTLQIDGLQILSSRNMNLDAAVALGEVANPNFIDMQFGVRMYWEKASTEDEINPTENENVWTALPETTGSPVNPIGDWGTISNMTIDNQNIAFNVDYQGVTYPVTSFTVEGDLGFIDKANDILYYTDPDSGDRMLYFNFGETLDSAILAARSFATVNEWKGEALWNLTQNEIKVTDVLKVYNYTASADNDGNIYSYFYMPDVPMDDLISVSSVLAYRYWNDGFLGIGDPEPDDIEYKIVTSTRGETSEVNPTWVETAYKSAYITGATTTAVLANAAIAGTTVPVYGWAVAGGIFLVGATLQVSDVQEWFAYDVEQIEHVIPSVALTNEINTYISEKSGDSTFNPNTDKLYKLHLATLQDGDEVEVMDELSNITQVVWESEGQIYVVNDDYIDDVWFGPGTEIPTFDNPLNIPDEAIWIGIGVVGLYLFSKMRLDKKPGLMILLLGVAVYILYRAGLL